MSGYGFFLTTDTAVKELLCPIDVNGIDRDSSNVDKYLETLDRKHLADNGNALVFLCKPLTPDEFDVVQCAAMGSGQEYGARQAFKLGCIMVKNWTDSDGTKRDLRRDELQHAINPAFRSLVGNLIVKMSKATEQLSL